MNVLKLRGKIVERGMNVEMLATQMGVDRATLYRKLRESEKFTIGDAHKIKEVLDLTTTETNEIFFGN